jgi:hypothetical protein
VAPLFLFCNKGAIKCLATQLIANNKLQNIWYSTLLSLTKIAKHLITQFIANNNKLQKILLQNIIQDLIQT